MRPSPPQSCGGFNSSSGPLVKMIIRDLESGAIREPASHQGLFVRRTALPVIAADLRPTCTGKPAAPDVPPGGPARPAAGGGTHDHGPITAYLLTLRT